MLSSVSLLLTSPAQSLDSGLKWRIVIWSGGRSGSSTSSLPSTHSEGAGTLVAICDTHSEGTSKDSRSEEHTSELQSLMLISYAVFCLKKQTTNAIRTRY